MVRRYRMTADGEKPVFASDRRLRAMGRAWAMKHHDGRYGEPASYGNVVHDTACAEQWKLLTGSYPSWYKPDGGEA